MIESLQPKSAPKASQIAQSQIWSTSNNAQDFGGLFASILGPLTAPSGAIDAQSERIGSPNETSGSSAASGNVLPGSVPNPDTALPTQASVGEPALEDFAVGMGIDRRLARLLLSKTSSRHRIQPEDAKFEAAAVGLTSTRNAVPTLDEPDAQGTVPLKDESLLQWRDAGNQVPPIAVEPQASPNIQGAGEFAAVEISEKPFSQSSQGDLIGPNVPLHTRNIQANQSEKLPADRNANLLAGLEALGSCVPSIADNSNARNYSPNTKGPFGSRIDGLRIAPPLVTEVAARQSTTEGSALQAAPVFTMYLDQGQVQVSSEYAGANVSGINDVISDSDGESRENSDQLNAWLQKNTSNSNSNAATVSAALLLEQRADVYKVRAVAQYKALQIEKIDQDSPQGGDADLGLAKRGIFGHEENTSLGAGLGGVAGSPRFEDSPNTASADAKIGVPAGIESDADRQSEFAAAVARRVLGAAQEGKWNVKIALEPESLGEMQVDLTLQSGALSAVVNVASPETQGILQASLPALQAELESQGFSMGSWTFGQSMSNQSNEYQRAFWFTQAPMEFNASKTNGVLTPLGDNGEPVKAPASTAVVDLYV